MSSKFVTFVHSYKILYFHIEAFYVLYISLANVMLIALVTGLKVQLLMVWFENHLIGLYMSGVLCPDLSLPPHLANYFATLPKDKDLFINSFKNVLLA